MSLVFLITNSDDLTQSVDRYFRYVCGTAIKSSHVPVDLGNGERWVPYAFAEVANWIELNVHNGELSSLCGAIAIVDLPDPAVESLTELNPISTKDGDWATVVGMLILVFPEVHWVCLTSHDQNVSPFFRKVHLLGASNPISNIVEVNREKLVTLFDPTGLRNGIRKQIKETKGDDGQTPVAPYIPLRSSFAAAIDEEEAYAYLNAYTAYRFGYAAHAVFSFGMLTHVFKVPSDESPKLVFEDLYLNFRDRPHDIHLSVLAKRDDLFPGLASGEMRVFITSGHSRATDQELRTNNEEYLLAWKEQNEHGTRYSKMLYKPLTGMFDLWRKSGVKRRLSAGNGLAPGYEWPPVLDEARLIGSHSSPGRLLDIADRLIARATRVLKEAQSVPQAVYGAVLALEAQEYLGHCTPTTSLEALALKNNFEVMAECKFYGVEYNKDVASRLAEIKREVKSIGFWFRGKTRALSILNAEAGIISQLVMEFKQYNQFDEEQICLMRLRALHRQLWLKKNKFLVWPFFYLRWYVEFLLGSMLVFALAIIFWIATFTVLFATLCDCHQGPEAQNLILHGLGHTLTTFFGLQPAHEIKEIERLGYASLALTMSAILVGFAHLGIFVSHLYSLIARR